MEQIIHRDVKLNAEVKRELRKDLGILAGEIRESKGTWCERLHIWKEVFKKEKLAEQLNSSNARYVVEFDIKEVENCLCEDVKGNKHTRSQGFMDNLRDDGATKLLYTYFLEKLDSSEASVVIPYAPFALHGLILYVSKRYVVTP